MALKAFVNYLLRTCCGYEIVAHNVQRQHSLRKLKLMADLGVTVVIDAGANSGQYASSLRTLGYRGRIISIEPNPIVFNELRRRMNHDANWAGVHSALGERDGHTLLNVAEITEVSSLLPATGRGVTVGWQAAESVRVPMRSLDSLAPELLCASDVVYLKLDIQGYEGLALDGAPRTLSRTAAIELEMSTVTLYEGEVLLPELTYRLHRLGFAVFSLDTVLVDYQSGRVLQAELLFTAA